MLLFGLSVKTPWQLLRGVVQGGAEVPGRCAAAFRAWSYGNPRLGAIKAIERWVSVRVLKKAGSRRSADHDRRRTTDVGRIL